jgi:hypothetical protein
MAMNSDFWLITVMAMIVGTALWLGFTELVDMHYMGIAGVYNN